MGVNYSGPKLVGAQLVNYKKQYLGPHPAQSLNSPWLAHMRSISTVLINLKS